MCDFFKNTNQDSDDETGRRQIHKDKEIERDNEKIWKFREIKVNIGRQMERKLERGHTINIERKKERERQ